VNTGLWLWPADEREQRRTLSTVASSPHLVKAMELLAKSKGGLSNSELGDLAADSSEWLTLWTVRQLTSLGFVEYSVDFFGGPAHYKLTELGKTAFGAVTGKPPQPKPAAPPAVVPAAAPAKA
jgi:hypothetical protein